MKKTTIGLINKKTTLHKQHTFFVHFFAVVLHDYNVKNFLKLLRYIFFGGNVVRVLALFHCRSFYLALVAASVMLSPPLQNFYVVLPLKKMSPLFFFISRSRFLSPFLSLGFAGLPPTLYFSLSISCSIFQICGHDN